jgi:hypothetical protein
VHPWRDLSRCEELNTIGSLAELGRWERVVLYGTLGQPLTIRFRFVADGPRLRSRLEPHLAPLRERELAEVAEHGKCIRPARTEGIVFLAIIAPALLLFGLSMIDLAGLSRAERTVRPYVPGVLCLAAIPFFVVLGIEMISRELTLTTDGLTLRGLLLNRSIPFQNVASITVKIIENGRHRIGERATVRSHDGQFIAITSSMPGYCAVLDLLRTRASGKDDLD